MDYIEGGEHTDGCLFCNMLALEDGPENLIIQRAKHAFVILNRYPYTNGQMMVVPYQHQSTLEHLSRAELSELMVLTTKAITALRETYGAQNFNVGINIGDAAGAGVAEHIHIHVLPRWTGDTSFMSTIAGVRVIPESLDRTFERLTQAWPTDE